MMTRRSLLMGVTVVGSAGCSHRNTVFHAPETIASQWVLADTEDAEAGEEIRELGLRYAMRASYEGPRPLTVTFYQMTAAASAFELMQKWRPEPGRLAFYHRAWFVVIESPGMEHRQLAAIATELEGSLPVN